MATNRLTVTDLDFDTIKTNLKNYLKSQSEFTDYDFEASGLNVLLDILAYNTHYNAYYLNMVANEAFMDTAVLRSSVVSHAKSLSYVPQSTSASRAIIDLTIPTGSNTADTLTLPRGFNFRTNLLDNATYNYTLLTDTTVDKVGSDFIFRNLSIYEGELISYDYTYNSATNPKAVFPIPDANVDTSTIVVTVQVSSSNLSSATYSLATDVLDVSSNSEVYFLQEGQDGKYEIYFGDAFIGKKLTDGNIVNMSYLVTSGSASNKSNNFTATSSVPPYLTYNITPVQQSAGGAERESVDSIKLNSTLQFATQNRLVTTKDYESYIKKTYGAIDSISVWGGQDEIPPVYGKVFISIKPKTNYFLTEAEKTRIIDEIVKPKSIVAVSAEIRDPEYLYLKLANKVLLDRKKTSLTDEQIKNLIRSAIFSYSDLNLNKFDSTFVLSKAQDSIDGVDLNSIVGSETTLRLEKRFTPDLNNSKTYTIKYNAKLHRGTILNRLSSSEFTVNDSLGTLRNAIIEEVPESYTGLSRIDVTDAGFGYTSAPTVTVTGDGTGATATATIVNGRVTAITITNRGINYSRAVVSFSGGNGYGATAIAVLDGRFGTLRTVYFNELSERQVINSNAGTIDYDTGEVTITNLRVLSVLTTDGDIRVNIESEDGIISSVRNTIITIDQTDSSSVTTEISAV
jgi:hypothetical protein